MEQKLLFFDIDGTILSHRTYEISESTKTAIATARANGHLCFINTGRTKGEMQDFILELGFDGCICGCGTYISLNDEVIFHQTFSQDLIRSVIADLRELELAAFLEGSSSVYYEEGILHPFLQFTKDGQNKDASIKIETWNAKDMSVDKFCIVYENLDRIALFMDKYKDTFDFINREEDFYEVIAKGYSKATAIAYLENHLKIPHDNTFAFGDSSNDLTMLKYVKHSIAMGNSNPEVLKIATFITKDVDQDGIYHALQHYGLI